MAMSDKQQLWQRFGLNATRGYMRRIPALLSELTFQMLLCLGRDVPDVLLTLKFRDESPAVDICEISWPETNRPAGVLPVGA